MSNSALEYLLFKNINESDNHNSYKVINNIIASFTPDVRADIINELADIDITELTSDEFDELVDILQNTSDETYSTVDTLYDYDFNSDFDNNDSVVFNEAPVGKMKTANMVRQKHKMGLNSIPKSKLKAMRIKNRVKNFKARLDAKKYYKQNRNVLKRYNKSYNAAVKTGKHKAAIRRKS